MKIYFNTAILLCLSLLLSGCQFDSTKDVVQSKDSLLSASTKRKISRTKKKGYSCKTINVKRDFSKNRHIFNPTKKQKKAIKIAKAKFIKKMYFKKYTLLKRKPSGKQDPKQTNKQKSLQIKNRYKLYFEKMKLLKNTYQYNDQVYTNMIRLEKRKILRRK